MFSPYGRLFAEARAPRPAPLGYPAPPLVFLPPGPQRSPVFLDGRSYGVPTCGGPLFAYCSSGPGPWRATTPIPAGNSTLASNLSSPDVPDVVLDFFDWLAESPGCHELGGRWVSVRPLRRRRLEQTWAWAFERLPTRAACWPVPRGVGGGAGHVQLRWSPLVSGPVLPRYLIALKWRGSGSYRPRVHPSISRD